MSDYADNKNIPIQEGDIRIDNCGNYFYITKDNYREISIIYDDMSVAEDRTCSFDNSLFIEHRDNVKEGLIEFINEYVEKN